VAELAVWHSVAREVFINALMAEILLFACKAAVLASLGCEYCILKAAVHLLCGGCCQVMAVLKADMLSQQYKINRGEGNLRETILYMLNSVTAVICVQ